MDASGVLPIPYRLRTLEEVRVAEQGNLLGLDGNYAVLLRVARQKQFASPPALRAARPEVRKEFYRLREERIRETTVRFEAVANLSLVHGFARLEASLPWLREIAGQPDLGQALGGLPPRFRAACRLEPPPRTPLAHYESALAIRRTLKQELLGQIRAGQGKLLAREELRRALAGFCLFAPGNDDVLQGVRSAEASGGEDPLYQCAVAELAFARLPMDMVQLLSPEPQAIRERLFAKLAKLELSGRQRAALSGYFPPGASRSDLDGMLERLVAVVQRMRMGEETRQALRHYLGSLRRTLARAPSLTRALFFPTSELAQMQALHVGGEVLRARRVTRESLHRSYAKVAELAFYPTKDYLDLWRGTVSGDCVDFTLSERQLDIPEFFNIRIFERDRWIGNLYMLDFTREEGVLLIDRVQIPRKVRVSFLDFFRTLGEVLQALFVDAPYERILAPIAISNHDTVQGAFNDYRRGLPSHKGILAAGHARDYFESLRGGCAYAVLGRKEAGAT